MSTRADLNNNPANIKVPSGGLEVAKKRYGDPNISIDPNPAADGGYFLKFSSPDYGKQATSTLLRNPLYQSQTVDSAMKTWSGGGYGGDIVPDLANKPVSQLSQEELNKLTESMYKREGYTGSTNQSSNNNLSHEQIIANINALEHQGAKPNEVQGYLDGLKQSSGFNPKPFSNPTKGQEFSMQQSDVQNTPQTDQRSLGSQLSNRATQASKALSDAASGKINPISGILQTVGAGAGAIGDATSKVLELIPGVKWLENEIGTGIGKLAQTPIGQSVVKSMTDFAQQHPELSADIGAGFNIVTAIPILRGLGVVKDVAFSGISQVLKKVAETAADKGLTEVAARTVAGRTALKEAGEMGIKKGIVIPRLLPDIENGKYIVKNAMDGAENLLNTVETKELQPILRQVAQKQATGQSLKTLETQAITNAMADPTLRAAGAVEDAIKQIQKRFSGWKFSYGDSVKVDIENELKRGVSSYVDWGTPAGDADYIIRKTLQTDVEDIAKNFGFKNVSEINQKMGNIIKGQKILKAIDGKTVKKTLTGRLLHAGVTAGSTAVGGALGGGIPGAVAGYLGGNLAGSIAEKGLGGGFIRNAILKRTGTGLVKPSLKNTLKRSAGLVGGALLQKANR